jgi:hypothetical protein
MSNTSRIILKAVVALIVLITSFIICSTISGLIFFFTEREWSSLALLSFILPFYFSYKFCYSKWANRTIWKRDNSKIKSKPIKHKKIKGFDAIDFFTYLFFAILSLAASYFIWVNVMLRGLMDGLLYTFEYFSLKTASIQTLYSILFLEDNSQTTRIILSVIIAAVIWYNELVNSNN